jgi:catechol 2,3-dioxygenase-like lactoylglutathione lyase family enzyme
VFGEKRMTVRFERAFGYQGDNMNLPVPNVDAALSFYRTILGFALVSRDSSPDSAVLSRDNVQIRLAENGGDPTQDGCAFHVVGVDALAAEYRANGLEKDSWQLDHETHDGITFKVFYVVAPDGLCYWFGEPVSAA